MINRLQITRAFLLFVSFALLSGCGTDTGNPGEKPASGIDEPQTIDASLGYRLCERISTCRGADQIACESQIRSSSGITAALSLDPQKYPDLSAAMNGVLNKELVVIDANLASCQTAISELSCNDPIVTASYNTSFPTDFDNAHHLLDASPDCSSAIKGRDQ